MARNGVDFAELEEIVEQLEGAENIRKISQQTLQPPNPKMTRKESSQSIHPVNGCKDESEENNEISDTDEGVPMEASSKGTVKGSVSLNYFKAGAHWSILLILLLSFLLVQFLASAIDYFVSVWYVDLYIVYKSQKTLSQCT